MKWRDPSLRANMKVHPAEPLVRRRLRRFSSRPYRNEPVLVEPLSHRGWRVAKQGEEDSQPVR
jgi:hypothetical protein